jgi:hypothetical protein
MKNDRYEVTLTFNDGNSASVYVGDSWLAAMYHYLAQTIAAADEVVFVTLETNTRG